MKHSKLNKGGMYDAIMKYMAGGKYMKEGGTDFGNLSVKAGIDENPEVTYADKIAGATMNQKKKGGRVYRMGGVNEMEHGGGLKVLIKAMQEGGMLNMMEHGGVHEGDPENPEKKTRKPGKLPLSKRKGLRFSRKRGRAENERLYDELIERYLDPEIGTGVGDAQSLARIAGDADDQARLDRKYGALGRLQRRINRAGNRFVKRGVNPNTGLPTALARSAANKQQALRKRAKLLNDEIKELRVGDRNQAAVQEMMDRGMDIPMPTYLGRFSF